MNSSLYLIDTSIWILLFRRQPPRDLANKVQELIAANTAAFNQIVKLELLAGARSQQDYSRVSDRLESLVSLPIRDTTWATAGKLIYSLRRSGVTASLPDIIIASTAIEGSAIVLHADADFDRIAALSDLQVESYARTA